MSQPLTVIQSGSYGKFNCINSKCEDNCCGGWGIVIDKRTYDLYRECDDRELKPMMDESVTVVEESPSEMAYARIQLSHDKCPFLTESMRCRIQEKLGEIALSRTCSTYPRAVNLVDGVLECSLYMSCPEAARTVLLDPNSMDLASSARSKTLRFASPPTLDTHDRRYTSKPYEHFPAIRDLVTAILKNRAYPLWERLIILGFFCDHLDKQIASSAASTSPQPSPPERGLTEGTSPQPSPPERGLTEGTSPHPSPPERGLTEGTRGAGHIRGETDTAAVGVDFGETVKGYAREIEQGLFDGAFKDVPCQTAVQIEFVTKWCDARVAEGSVNPRFIATYREFQEGLGTEKPEEAYVNASARYYQPFMDAHPHIMENYLHNYMFKALFPFGPQKSLYFEQKSVFDEYVLLIAHYALVRGLLVGSAAYHGEAFGEAQVVSTVQSFSKAIEHNLPFLKRILSFLEGRNLNSLVSMATLART